MTTPRAGRLVDTDSLDLAVAALREIDRRSGIERMLGAGELILMRFFDGNAETWRERRHNKGNAIRRLAERDDCPFGRSALNDAVAIFLAVTESPSIRTLVHIEASHVAAVLSLSTAEREQLLSLANRERMGVRALRTKIIEMRRACGERRGRPRLSPEQRVLVGLLSAERRFTAALKEVEAADCTGPVARQHLRRLANRVAAFEARITALSADRVPERANSLRRLGQA